MAAMTTIVDKPLAEIEELKNSTIWWSLSGLFVAAIALYAVATSFSDPLYGGVPGVILLLLLPAVWLLLQKSHYLAAAWVLVIGCLGVNLLLIAWSGLVEAVIFLALPVGLAAVLIGLPGGIAMAMGCTYILLFIPGVSAQIEPVLRYVAVVQIWGTIWLVWLTSRPLLMARQWFEASYRQSHEALEESRNYQAQLKQSTEELAESNLQLTRLNRLAQGLRQRAEEARRSKEQFVANVSHELRTPLNMIIGFIEMAMHAPETYGRNIPQSLLADLDIVLRNSRHLSSLVDDVLDLSQIDAGQMALLKERVGLSQIIAGAVTAVQPLFNTKGLTLQTDIPSNLPLLHCDRTRIRQVLLNLLSNAGRFTEQGGVRVQARQKRNQVIVSVTDTGPGISADEIDEVFKPFQQLDGSIHSHWAGSGLGLSISKHFVELHEGKMWLESEEGQGTTFFFGLPLVETAEPFAGGAARWVVPDGALRDRSQRTPLPPLRDRPRLLIFETDGILRRVLTRYLHDVELVSVTSLAEAVQEIEQVPAQALLINAVSVSDSLLQIEKEITLPFGLPAIVCSVPGLRVAADNLGVADYLVKPISREALLAVLDHLPLAGKTILVVDDEPDALRLFRRMLASAQRDYRVLRATNGRQAQHILREQQPDVVLVDLMMPEMDGFQLIAEMHQNPKWRDIPIVVISAQDPSGQPIVSKSLAVIRGGGLAMPRLLATIEALVNTLSVQPVSLGVEGGQEVLATEGLVQEAGGPQA